MEEKWWPSVLNDALFGQIIWREVKFYLPKCNLSSEKELTCHFWKNRMTKLFFSTFFAIKVQVKCIGVFSRGKSLFFSLPRLFSQVCNCQIFWRRTTTKVPVRCNIGTTGFFHKIPPPPSPRSAKPLKFVFLHTNLRSLIRWKIQKISLLSF